MINNSFFQDVKVNIFDLFPKLFTTQKLKYTKLSPHKSTTPNEIIINKTTTYTNHYFYLIFNKLYNFYDLIKLINLKKVLLR